MLSEPILLTSEYTKTSLARAVPDAYYGGQSWWLPPEPSPESARVALRLFPKLNFDQPELVARARALNDEYRPIDKAPPQTGPLDADPWQRVTHELRRRLDAWHPPLRPPIELHQFQRDDCAYAIDRLNKGYGAYLGWEMGLGKTLGACMVMDGWDANFVFLTCPANAITDPWLEHLNAWCPWLKQIIVGRTAEKRQAAVDEAVACKRAGTPFILICHYEAMKLIEGKHKNGLNRIKGFDLKIADESHLFQSRTAQRTSAFRRIKAVGTLLLSGSVMSGNPERLFVPYQIMAPHIYRSQWEHWNDRFLEVTPTEYGNVVTGPKMHRLPAFRDELGDRLVVRRATDYLDIPEPHIVNHACSMTKRQKQAYHDLADELLAELPDGTVYATTDGAPLVTALRRVTSGGVPLPEGGFESAKLDDVVDVLVQAGDLQSVIFSWHVDIVYELQRRLAERRITSGTVTGDERRRDRDAAVSLFKRGGTKVLLATIKTLSTAVNLQNAGLVGMVEESYDPIDNEQAVGRVVRQGQTGAVSVHYWRVANSVDDLGVLPALISKQALRQLVLGVGA